MKEDKLDKEIAASLKKKLVEAAVPYELGAWEGFQKKRALRKRKNITYWVSGVAASLLLLAVGVNSVDFSGNGNANSTEVQLAESTEKIPDSRIEEFSTKESEPVAENSPVESPKELEPNTNASGSKRVIETTKDQKSETISADTKALATVPQSVEKPAKIEKAKITPEPPRTIKSEITPADTKALATVPQPLENPLKTEKPKVTPEVPVITNEKTVAQVTEKPSTQQSLLAVKEEEKQIAAETPEESLDLAKAEEQVKPEEKQQFVAESDFPVIEKSKTTVGLGMGLSPGFGASQDDNQVATAQTIGLGMLVDIKLPGKFTLGSGLGLNYLNQNNEQESTVMAFGNSYPQVEKLEVRQMQVEVPVFVKYPVTRNNSVSIQAGFSNYYALNETANQENTVERQSAFYASDALGSSSVSLRQEAVTESSTLESKSGKFYPFATLNFGVNLRVLETKGANYVIMPFYNYQVKQVSGYGDTYGLFGASFKMNFGGK